MDADRLLDGLDPEQRAAASAVRGPVVILAGAGTGKTRAITHRMAYAVATGRQDARYGLAVTFTTRAAGEMRERLARLGVAQVAVATFHAAALRQLRHFWPVSVGRGAPKVQASKVATVARVLRRARGAGSATMARDVAAEIEWAKANGVLPADYAARAATAMRAVPDLEATAVATAYAAYLETMAEQGMVDFEDVLLSMVGILADRPDIAEQVRSRYRWFTVDEYQDVSPLQQSLLDLWLGDRAELCVVGDPAQTIYSFAGATSRYLAGFPQRYPHATQVQLVRSYRSRPPIIAAANALMADPRRAVRSDPLRLTPTRDGGDPVVVTACADDIDEAGHVASRVSALIGAGTPADRIAVLVRTNAGSEPIEAALSEAGLPYRVRGSERYFDRAEVREAVIRYRGAAVAEPAGDAAALMLGCLAAMGFDAADPPQGRSESRSRWESLSALADLATRLRAEGIATVPADVVAELDRRATYQAAPEAAAVTVATLHAAKGLEWSAVFIAGVAEGTVPINYARTPEALEEERRLLYVGITRARDHLEVTWPRARSAGGGRSRSRFLAALEDGGGTGAATGAGSVRAGSAGPVGAVRRRRPPARCRGCGAGLVTGRERALLRCSACPATLDETLYAALRAWRRGRAAGTGQPAYAVLTDATLRAIAELRPTDSEALAAIVGIGPIKLTAYGDELLALVRGDGWANPGTQRSISARTGTSASS